jgi:S1-C subfamily serine protease
VNVILFYSLKLMYYDDHDKPSLTKMVIVALISATFVISLISFSSYNTGAQRFGDNINSNNNTNSTLLTGLFTKVNQSVVTVNVANETDPSNSTSGSGFIYDNDGHVLTTRSAVAANIQGDIDITFSDGTIHRAKVIGTDRFSDLAVLQLQDVVIPKYKLVPLPIGNSSELKVGEQAITIASPFGLSGVLTEGVIGKLGALIPSELGEEGEETAPSFSIPDIIVTDVPTNPGSAGGPLLNIRGEVIGINSAIFSSTGEFAGISFALPSNTVTKVVPSLIATGTYMHPYIGITGIDITPEIAEAIGVTEAGGFLVTDVTAEGPAAKAGIQGGDSLTNVNGREIALGGDVILGIDDNNKTVNKIDDILTYLERERQVGDNVKLTVLRDGQLQEMNVIVGSRPFVSSSAPTTSDILTYQNSAYGIRIQYPANWTKDEQDFDPNDGVTDIVVFSSPLENRLDRYSENLGISMERLSNQDMTLEEYVTSLITDYNETLTDFNLIESNTSTTLGGGDNNRPAYRLLYTDKEDDANYKTMEIGTIIGDRVYFINYVAEQEKYSNYLPNIQMMINSLQIK